MSLSRVLPLSALNYEISGLSELGHSLISIRLVQIDALWYAACGAAVFWSLVRNSVQNAADQVEYMGTSRLDRAYALSDQLHLRRSLSIAGAHKQIERVVAAAREASWHGRPAYIV